MTAPIVLPSPISLSQSFNKKIGEFSLTAFRNVMYGVNSFCMSVKRTSALVSANFFQVIRSVVSLPLPSHPLKPPLHG